MTLPCDVFHTSSWKGLRYPYQEVLIFPVWIMNKWNTMST